MENGKTKESYIIKEGIFSVTFFLTGLIVLSVAISLLFYLNLSLRLDESQSLWQTKGSLSSIINLVAHDVHVPLYHIILHFWQTFFGNAVLTARALSLLFFLLNIPAFYLLGKTAYSHKVGIFAATIFAISPFMIWYGNEIRMYSLFSLLITLNYYFFISIYKKRKTYAWIGYVLTALLGIYTHYFFFLALASQMIFYFFNRSIFPTRSLRNFLISAGIVALGFLPWIIYVIRLGSASEMRPLLSTPSTFDIFNTFSYFLFGFHPDLMNTLLISLWPLAVLFAFLALQKNKKITPESRFFILAVFVPLAIAYIISFLFRPLFLPRYLILALPPLFLIISAIFYTYPNRLSVFFQGAFISTLLVTLFLQGYRTDTPVKEDYRAAAEFLDREVEPRDLIIVSAPFTVYPIEYYYHGLAEIETLPYWDRLLPGGIPRLESKYLPEAVDKIKGNHERAFLLLSYDQGYEKDIKSYFDNSFEQLGAKSFSPGMNLYIYKLKYD